MKASPQKFYGRHTESVDNMVCPSLPVHLVLSESKIKSNHVKVKSKTHESRDKDEAMKTETNTTRSTYEIKENTHKTKSKIFV
jgi:hypothetical protein